MRTIESVMIESGRFVGKKGSWFLLQRKSSGDWGNPQDGTRRRHPILGMYGLGILSMTGTQRRQLSDLECCR